jgi:hypothetical protein
VIAGLLASGDGLRQTVELHVLLTKIETQYVGLLE